MSVCWCDTSEKAVEGASESGRLERSIADGWKDLKILPPLFWHSQCTWTTGREHPKTLVTHPSPLHCSARIHASDGRRRDTDGPVRRRPSYGARHTPPRAVTDPLSGRHPRAPTRERDCRLRHRRGSHRARVRGVQAGRGDRRRSGPGLREGQGRAVEEEQEREWRRERVHPPGRRRLQVVE